MQTMYVIMGAGHVVDEYGNYELDYNPISFHLTEKGAQEYIALYLWESGKTKNLLQDNLTDEMYYVTTEKLHP